MPLRRHRVHSVPFAPFALPNSSSQLHRLLLNKMVMTAIFPSLPGQGWSVTKSPRFATRIQRAVSGRELRALDQPYPLWTWTLTYPLLRDRNDARSPARAGRRL